MFTKPAELAIFYDNRNPSHVGVCEKRIAAAIHNYNILDFIWKMTGPSKSLLILANSGKYHTTPHMDMAGVTGNR